MPLHDAAVDIPAPRTPDRNTTRGPMFLQDARRPGALVVPELSAELIEKNVE